jgi:hypothetical protein
MIFPNRRASLSTSWRRREAVSSYRGYGFEVEGTPQLLSFNTNRQALSTISANFAPRILGREDDAHSVLIPEKPSRKPVTDHSALCTPEAPIKALASGLHEESWMAW